MGFADRDLYPKSWDLGKSVLILSALGIFAKVLRIDLSKMPVLGVTLGPDASSLVPGFIGLALMYCLLAFVLARLEGAMSLMTDKNSKATLEAATKNPVLVWLSLLSLPLAITIYSLPYVLGIFGVIYLWSDSIAVIRLVLTNAFQ